MTPNQVRHLESLLAIAQDAQKAQDAEQAVRLVRVLKVSCEQFLASMEAGR